MYIAGRGHVPYWLDVALFVIVQCSLAVGCVLAWAPKLSLNALGASAFIAVVFSSVFAGGMPSWASIGLIAASVSVGWLCFVNDLIKLRTWPIGPTSTVFAVYLGAETVTIALLLSSTDVWLGWELVGPVQLTASVAVVMYHSALLSDLRKSSR